MLVRKNAGHVGIRVVVEFEIRRFHVLLLVEHVDGIANQKNTPFPQNPNSVVFAMYCLVSTIAFQKVSD